MIKEIWFFSLREKVIQLFLEARMHPVMQDVEEDSEMKVNAC